MAQEGARLYMSLTRGGGPTQQVFILGTTLLAESVSRFLTNSLNDPSYIRAQTQNIKAVFTGEGNANVYINNDTLQAATASNTVSNLSSSTTSVSSATSSGVIPGSLTPSSSVPGLQEEIAKSSIGIDIDLVAFSESILNKIMTYLNYLFQPVPHNFTIDVMSNHIQNLSILLFILTILILIFFLSLLFNLTIFIFSKRLLNYFTNKYII